MPNVSRASKSRETTTIGRVKITPSGIEPDRDGTRGITERLDEIILWLKINAYVTSGKQLEFKDFVARHEQLCGENKA